MFFSFEGIDGSGKSTQAQLLAEALRKRGQEVVEVREPGGTPLGERIRSLLLDPQAEIASRAELLLFSAARAQLVLQVIEPALQRGATVIADRFFDSSTAYQGGGRGLADPEWMSALHHFATAGRNPDRTYLIDIDLETAASRSSSRPLDRMERAGVPFYEAVSATYRQLAKAEPRRIRVLDGQQAVDRLHDQILVDALKAQMG